MGILFIFDGAFGTGKQLVLDYLATHFIGENMGCVIPKYTVENPEFRTNPNISIDLNIIDDDDFNRIIAEESCIHYTFTDQRYAFSKHEMDRQMESHKYVFVVIRDVTTIRRLKNQLGAHAVPVYIYTDPRDLAEGLKKKGTTELNQIAYHIKRQELAWQDYLNMGPELYEHIIINNNKEQDVHDQVNSLIDLHSSQR